MTHKEMIQMIVGVHGSSHFDPRAIDTIDVDEIESYRNTRRAIKTLAYIIDILYAATFHRFNGTCVIRVACNAVTSPLKQRKNKDPHISENKCREFSLHKTISLSPSRDIVS